MKLFVISAIALQFLSAQCLSQPTHPGASLNIGSTPAGGYVTVDGKYAGTTPLSIVDVVPGRHVLTFRKEGFITVSDTIVAARGDTVDCRVRFDPACELIVESDPAGAAVYIDDRFRGTTPLRLPEMHEGKHAVIVTTQKYIRWSDSVTIGVGTPASVHVRLQPVLGSISVDVSGPDQDIFIGGREVGSGPVSMYSHAMGDVLIGARDRATGEWVSGHFWVPPEGHVRVATQFNCPSPEVFYYSLIFPGLGQSLAGHTVEGIVYGTCFAAAGFLGIEAYRSFQDESNKYDAALTSYRSANTRVGAMDFHRPVLDAYEDVRRARNRTITFVALTAGVYVVSLADALFFHSTANRIIAIEENNAVPEAGVRMPGGNGVQLSVRIPL